MPLKPLNAKEPKVVPAVESKQFDNLFVESLKLTTLGNKQRLSVQFRYYDYNTGEFSSKTKNLLIDDLAKTIASKQAEAKVNDILDLLVELLDEQDV